MKLIKLWILCIAILLVFVAIPVFAGQLGGQMSPSNTATLANQASSLVSSYSGSTNASNITVTSTSTDLVVLSFGTSGTDYVTGVHVMGTKGATAGAFKIHLRLTGGTISCAYPGLSFNFLSTTDTQGTNSTFEVSTYVPASDTFGISMFLVCHVNSPGSVALAATSAGSNATVSINYARFFVYQFAK